jgi:hypothetical protein
MPWSRAFHVLIPLPDGRMLRTLRDAGEYIQELPRATHQRPEWKIAIEMLFAEIAMRKAVNASGPLPSTASSTPATWCRFRCGLSSVFWLANVPSRVVAVAVLRRTSYLPT